MAFHVTVKGGPDDGVSFRVDGQAIVGRGPRCQVQLTDQAVSWEHAALQDQNGRLFVQNLAAAGIKVHGRSVAGEVRLVDGDEVEIRPVISGGC
jgi:predicted component of type VI protein secretion system